MEKGMREMTPEEVSQNGKSPKTYESVEAAVADGIAYNQVFIVRGVRNTIAHPVSAASLVARGLGVPPHGFQRLRE